MKNSILFSVFLMLSCLGAWGQIGGDYNPDSPSDPNTPVQKYTLTVKATPLDGGSFNLTDEKLTVGSNNSLRAYSNTDFVFKHWMIGDSILSTSPDMEFVMPAHNVQMTGVFEYNPASPANPGRNHWDKQTGEVIVDDFTPGRLSSAISTAISGSSSNDVQTIIVAGRITSNDFGVANNYNNCTRLDLSRVTGVTEVPSYAFDYSNLETVCLPATIEKIGTRAFAECSQLSSLTVYAMTPPVLERNVFYNVPDGLEVYVPAAAIPQYQEAEGWKDLIMLPIQEDIRNLTVNLPAGINVADYAQMWLELTNIKNGQHIHYIMTDRTAYTFMNLIRNTSWNVTLRNERGDVFGRLENVEVKDEDVSVTFASLAQPKSVILSVKTPEGQDVTQQTQIIWTDGEGKYLSQSRSLTGLPVGYKAKYRIVLSEQLAMLYHAPAEADYTLTAAANNPVCQLTAIGQMKVAGKVVDKKTKQPIYGAVISASQIFSGRYTKTFSCKTDNKGEYALNLYKVPSTLAFSATDYVSESMDCATIIDATEDLALPEVALKEITGAVITLGFTYTPCVADGETADVQNWYSDYSNVDYTLYNRTQQHAVSQFNVQYPQIVLLEDVADGDELLLTATSRTGAFMPVQTSVTIAEQAAEATFSIVELGKIEASFGKNANAAVRGILYDGHGKLVKAYGYSQAALSIGGLTDGDYTLVSMGDSRFFGSIYDLAQFTQAGLTEGADYVKSAVTVQSGKVCKIAIAEIPTFDESKLYYTGENTSFTVNKPSLVAGNYLTLTGRIDFKQAYSSAVGNLSLVVDLPENCSFVENSVMVGNSTGSYTLNGSRLTIPVAQQNDRVRFCVIPTLGGDYAPSAFAQFDMDGGTITQPIGSAHYTAKDLSIVVPSTVAKTTVPVSGTAIGKCDIEVFDNNTLIGKTQSLANGTWSTSCELYNPHDLSYHNIFAKVLTRDGTLLQSMTHECVFDKNAIEPKSVTMSFYNNWLRDNVEVVYDYETKTTSSNSYMFYTTTDVTFMIDFTDNDTTKIDNVKLFVITDDNKIITLYPVYDGEKNKYVASHQFSSNSLPVNVCVDFMPSCYTEVDNTTVLNEQVQAANTCLAMLQEYIEENVEMMLIDETDTSCTYSVSTLSSAKHQILKLTVLDYDTAKYMLQQYPFDHICSENGTGYTCRRIEIEEDTALFFLIDTEKEIALEIRMTNANGSPVLAKTNKSIVSSLKNWITEFKIPEKASKRFGESLNFLGDLLYIKSYANYINDVYAFEEKVDIMLKSIGMLDKRHANISSLLNQKCKNGAYCLDPETRQKYSDQLNKIKSKREKDIEVFGNYLTEWGNKISKSAILSTVEMIAGKATSYLAEKWSKVTHFFDPIKNDKIGEWIIAFYKSSLDVSLFGADFAASLYIDENFNYKDIEEDMQQWTKDRTDNYIRLYEEIEKGIERDRKNCIPEPSEPEQIEPLFPSVTPIHDPSGYVYEAVATNRLEGVTATCYYKEMVEDMYGDLHENIVKWDAAEYAQENPLFTDENGMYRWDVPQGMWQVKFEKEGYETTYSDWLPVPPPQLEVNIAMKQNVQPVVKHARAFEDAVEVEFDKYMIPDLLTADNILVMADGKALSGNVELLNEEVSYEGETDTYASKVRFNAADPFPTKEVTLMVKNRVKSYAGIRMQDDYRQAFTVEQEIRKIVCDSLATVIYGEAGGLTVSVLPAAASAGRKLKVRPSSSLIISLENEEVTLDEEGKAVVHFNGELPGLAALTFEVEGYDLTATSLINVVQMSAITTAAPRASIASGSVVEKGTAVTLSCATKDAVIYYTLDGSCPCDEAGTRKKYDGTPIIINEDVTIKAMAVAPDMYESDVATFSYMVADVGIDEVTVDAGIEIFPVPVRETLNVTAGDKTIKRVSVITTKGTLVATSAGASQKMSLNVGKLPAGIYIVNVVTEDGVFNRKIRKVQ